MAQYTYNISASYIGEGLEDSNFYIFHTECGNFDNLVTVDGSIFVPSSSLADGFQLSLDSSINTLYLYPVSGECPLGCGYNYVLNLVPPSSPTPTPSVSPSRTPSISITPSITRTPGSSVTPTASTSVSTSPEASPPVTPSTSISSTPGASPTASPSITPSRTPSISSTPSVSVTPSNTPSISISTSPEGSPPPTPSISISRTPSISVTPSISRTPSISISKTPSVSISRTPSSSPPPPAYEAFGIHLVSIGFSGTVFTATWTDADYSGWQRGQLASLLGSYINSNNSFQIWSSTGTNLLASVSTNVNGATSISYSEDGTQMVLTATNISGTGGGYGLLRYIS